MVWCLEELYSSIVLGQFDSKDAAAAAAAAASAKAKTGQWAQAQAHGQALVGPGNLPWQPQCREVLLSVPGVTMPGLLKLEKVLTDTTQKKKRRTLFEDMCMEVRIEVHFFSFSFLFFSFLFLFFASISLHRIQLNCTRISPLPFSPSHSLDRTQIRPCGLWV
jgi:hypothetical protein